MPNFKELDAAVTLAEQMGAADGPIVLMTKRTTRPCWSLGRRMRRL